MRVDVAIVPPADPPLEQTCLVVDVLRATSVLAVLLDRGVQQIYPTATIEDGLALRDALVAAGTAAFLLGEREGLPPEGFDAGNSPTALEAAELDVAVAVQATSNGTPALLACVGSPLVMPAAVVNAGAVTRAALEAGRDVLIVCAGLHGGFGEDDVLAAGLLAERLVAGGATTGPEADDALRRYEAVRDDLAEAFRRTEHGAITVERGFDEDIVLCATADRYQTVAALGEIGGRPVLTPMAHRGTGSSPGA
jgi:2-phosphosulfolactate phosphatase